jgi:hypothetical protein
MSRENVETFKRAADAYNRRDVEALLRELDLEVEWHSAILMPLGREARMHRGHQGVREGLRDLYEALAGFHVEYSEIRDLSDRIVGIGRVRIEAERGRDRVALDQRDRREERQGDSGLELPRFQRGPRSRRAAGVGDVAGERRASASEVRELWCHGGTT